MLQGKIIVFIFMAILVVNSCSNQTGQGGRAKMLKSDSDKAKNTMEHVLRAIKEQDKENLKSLFSKRAMYEAENPDVGVESLLGFVQGKVQSWSIDTGPITDTSVDEGEKTEELKTWFAVDTESQRYLFFILEYTIDTANPDNVGIYALRAIKAEDEEKEFTYWQDMKIPGIYCPGLE